MTTTENASATPTVICSEPTRDEIAVCAFLAWEKEGRQPGRDFDYWLQAESQLRKVHREKAGAAAALAALPWPRPTRAASVRKTVRRATTPARKTTSARTNRSLRAV